jgi:hypothetical protein
MYLSGQISASAALLPGKELDTQYIEKKINFCAKLSTTP